MEFSNRYLSCSSCTSRTRQREFSITPIEISRLHSDIAAIAGFTQSPGHGATRPTFSSTWRQARDYIEAQLAACGCRVRIDAAGNLHARPAALDWDTPAWLSGSHIDTVPHGGDFDGVAGCVVPLELLRAAHEQRRTIPLELVVFAEEEGTTFGMGMLGSRAWVGEIDAARLGALHNPDGESYIAAGAGHGVRPGDLARERACPAAYRGLIEVHIEQGPGMWKNGVPVAIVTAIAGRFQYRCSLTGTANHAGSTSMTDRRDALAGAAEVIGALEALARRISPQAVITVGRIECRPNAINVIADRVDFTIDFRAPDNGEIGDGDRQITAMLERIAACRGLRHEIASTETQPAVAMDAALCDHLRRAAVRTGVAHLPSTITGALHDSAVVAPYIPTAMIFVASRDGISHNPAEFSRVEDVGTAAGILWSLVTGDDPG